MPLPLGQSGLEDAEEPFGLSRVAPFSPQPFYPQLQLRDAPLTRGNVLLGLGEVRLLLSELRFSSGRSIHAR